ncbi:MAG: hypothetical protein HGA44_10095 [Cellulomonadaceae bacterium]|nr:hypothetical protein [Cellulomonadaceae bacterium]
MSTHPRLVLAGWVLVAPTSGARALGSSLPASILTISDCIQETFPRPPSWDWFTDLAEAQRARRGHETAARLVSVAMSPEDADEFIEQGAVDQPPEALALLRRHLPLGDGTIPLGYEIVGAEHGLDFHSWHCHGYADEVHARLGISTNGYGLVPTHENAKAVLRWMLARPAREAPAPVPWCVVALAPA